MWPGNKTSDIACELDADGILIVTLSRVDRLNAFTVRMAKELVEAFGRASADDAVKAIVVTGAGRAFCAGMELDADAGGHANVFGLDESLQPTMDDLDHRLDDPAILNGLRDTGGRVALAIFDCTKPVVAAINGAAVGVGATLTLPMDMRIAADTARIGFVFANLGIVPDACSSWFLPRIVGLPRALQWSLSGEIIPAADALQAGLVDRVVPVSEVLTEARRQALRFGHARSPVSAALTRQMMWRCSAAPHPIEAHKVESLAIWHTSQGDGKEGVRAFLDKRAPRFESRASQMPDFYPWWN
ncbi:MAG: enoyl-CoA hydratase [Polaromonas sp.]|nr:enoyl-CoA hydratase [Polaromonas sp.]